MIEYVVGLLAGIVIGKYAINWEQRYRIALRNLATRCINSPHTVTADTVFMEVKLALLCDDLP